MIREDDGTGALAGDYGAVSYRVVLTGRETPTLRDLGQSAPYLHTGRKRELEDVLDFYIDSARKARQGKLRNPSPELSDMFLTDGDVDPLAAFLRALNEDYD